MNIAPLIAPIIMFSILLVVAAVLRYNDGKKRSKKRTTKYIVWIEPFSEEYTQPIIMMMSEPTAIAAQKSRAKKGGKPFIYESDAQALADFMIVNWAWQVELPANTFGLNSGE